MNIEPLEIKHNTLREDLESVRVAERIYFDFDDTLIQYRLRTQFGAILVSLLGLDVTDLLAIELLYSDSIRPEVIEWICSISEERCGSRWAIISSARRASYAIDDEKSRGMIIRSSTGMDVGNFWDRFRYISAHLDRSAYVQYPPSLNEFLNFLQADRKQIGVISNSTTLLVTNGLAYLQSLGINTDVISEIFCLKDPEMESKFGIKPRSTILTALTNNVQKVLYIGNTVQDLEFAQRSGAYGLMYDPMNLKPRQSHRFTSYSHLLNYTNGGS